MVEKKYTLGWFIRSLVLWLVAAIMLLPLFHIVSVSLSSNVEVLKNTITFWPKGFSLEAYKFILGKPLIYNAYKNTIIYTVTGTLAALFVLTTGAYALSKKRCPFAKPVNFLIMITMFFGGGMIPTYLAVKWLGLLDTLWAIILPTAFSAWNCIIMRSFFASYPAEIEESGRLDGLNDIGVLWYLVLPTSTAVLATIGLFCAVGMWNNFFGPLIYLSDESKYPLQIVLRQLILQSISDGMETGPSLNIAENSIKYGTILVSIIPIIAVYPWLQKYFVKGVMIGSIKG
ncbi:MAG: carbohydrate ABC transporter permease [Oscillospiraceae bacterium]|nr:carbohydrate ABC transporter permease [Oscillospiraceae bacterium]